MTHTVDGALANWVADISLRLLPVFLTAEPSQPGSGGGRLGCWAHDHSQGTKEAGSSMVVPLEASQVSVSVTAHGWVSEDKVCAEQENGNTREPDDEARGGGALIIEDSRRHE